MRRANPDLEIFNKPFEKCHEMFCLSDIARNRFLQEVFGERCITTQLDPQQKMALWLAWVTHEGILGRCSLLQSLNKLGIFIL